MTDQAIAVQRVVARLMHAIDLRRGPDAADLLGDEVTTHYTALFGGGKHPVSAASAACQG